MEGTVVYTGVHKHLVLLRTQDVVKATLWQQERK